MTYPGGKAGSGVYQKIINQIPPHEIYIEPFLGHGSVMLHKRPAASSIGIDCDGDVVKHWRDLLAENGDAHDRGSCNVIHGDAISYLQSYDWKGGEFVYADPPYLMETRSSKKAIYKFEFAEAEQHTKLLRVLRSLPCMVAISGYWSYLYDSMLHGWRSIHYNTVNRSGKVVTELLWMNYPEPTALHDYRYLGENFRQRERLKRIRTRWLARISRMGRLEQYMLRSAIAEFGDPSSHDRTSSEMAIIEARRK
jgi:site-specific DNA-adenine methylase